MIYLDETTYVLGAWFLNGPKEDWLGMVTSRSGGPLTLDYRFRDHADRDSASWWTAQFPRASEDRVIEIVDGMMTDMRNVGFSTEEPWRRIIRGNTDKAIEVLADSPFFTFVRPN